MFSGQLGSRVEPRRSEVQRVCPIMTSIKGRVSDALYFIFIIRLSIVCPVSLIRFAILHRFSLLFI